MDTTDTAITAADLNSEAEASRPLDAFVPVSGTRPVVVLLDVLAVPVVILRTTSDETVEALPPHGPTLTLSRDYTATPVIDPGTRAECLARAVTHLRDENRAQATQLHHTRADLAVAQERLSAVLFEIRAYAIRRHLDGDICRDGLNDFLNEFDLGEYQPRVRISYTITGTYEVDSSDPDTATRDAEGYLDVNLSRVDNVVDDSSTVDVQVTSADTVDDTMDD